MATITLIAHAASAAGSSVVLDCFDRCHAEPFCDLLPHGHMWPRDPDTTLAKVCMTLSLEISRVDKRIDAMLLESFPDTAQETLEDWERIAGLPTNCEPELAPTVAQRQQNVVDVLTQNSALTETFFGDLAIACGYPPPIITKNSAFCTGVNCAGDPVCGVGALLTVFFQFPTGANNELLECKIREWWTPVFTLVITFV